MDNQLSRIASFIDSLGSDSIVGNEQSFLLSTDMSAIGGDNGGDCENQTVADCSKVNNGGDCKNYDGLCSYSDNIGACKNFPAKPATNTTYPSCTN